MSEEKKPAKVPKGGRKGGSIFPRINLEAAVGYAKRLVSKTHTGPQPKDVIYSGVLDSTSSVGDVKISALKQYGFVDGDTKGFSASGPAKQLASAPEEELVQHYRAAALRPKIFKALFDTYHADSVSYGKLKQRAANLKVHPDETENCVNIYLQSAQLAGLVVQEGDSFKHLADSEVNAPVVKQDDVSGQGELEHDKVDEPEGASVAESAGGVPEQKPSGMGGSGEAGSSPRAIFNVNVTLDSSLDTEKLQKQLELLKRYGAI